MAESAPNSCIVPKPCNPEVGERPGAQPQSKKDDHNRDHRGASYLPAMRIRHQQPEINGTEQPGIADQVQQPQLPHATMFRAHFTVTVSASLVERYRSEERRVGKEWRSPWA